MPHGHLMDAALFPDGYLLFSCRREKKRLDASPSHSLHLLPADALFSFWPSKVFFSPLEENIMQFLLQI